MINFFFCNQEIFLTLAVVGKLLYMLSCADKDTMWIAKNGEVMEEVTIVISG